MGLLAIVAIAAMMGAASVAPAYAAGKPTTETFSDSFTMPYGTLCGAENTVADILFEATITTWPDKNMERIVVITTGELSDGNGNAVGEIKGKETFQSNSEGNGASQYKLKLTVKCSDGGSEKIVAVHNINRNN